jgi:hypothetical protein
VIPVWLSFSSPKVTTASLTVPGYMNPELVAGGSEVSLSDAQRSSSFPVEVPDTDTASESTVSDVWMRGDPAHEVLIDFMSGLREIIKPSSFLSTSPQGWYDRQVKEGISGQTSVVGGLTYFVVPGDAEGDLGSVTFVDGGVFVSVINHGNLTSIDLQKAAESIAASVAGTTLSASQ